MFGRKEKKAEASFEAYKTIRNLDCKFKWNIGRNWEESYQCYLCALKRVHQNY
jgi:hypothetical protein